jgi:hypothetical protein
LEGTGERHRLQNTKYQNTKTKQSTEHNFQFLISKQFSVNFHCFNESNKGVSLFEKLYH